MPLLSSALLLRTHSLTLVLFAYYLLTSPWTLVSSAPIWLLGESMFVRAPIYAPDHLHPSDPGSNHHHHRGRDLRPPPALLQNPARGPGTIPALTGTAAERELFAVVAVLLLAYALMQFIFAGDLTLILPSGPTSTRGGSKQGAAPPAGTTPMASSARLAEELYTLLTAQSRWLTLAGLHVIASSALVFWIYMFHSREAPTQSGDYYSISDLLANRVTFTAGLANMLFWGYLWTTVKDEGKEVGNLLARRRAMEEEEEEE